MKNLLIILIACLATQFVIADTIAINRKIKDLEREVKQIDTNQLNYKIEKDLLKETYSNNYEKISLIITLILGITGVFGYLGLKDITSIKKEYEKELSNLRQIQGQFNLKSKEFESERKKFDEDLKSIIKDNEEQSRKIKLIELKDKVRMLLKDNSLSSALEFANVALDISKEDTELLNLKGSILCRLNQLKEALQCFTLARASNPTDNPTTLNTVECLYFVNDLVTAKKIIDDNKSLFQEKEHGKLLELLNIFELYHTSKKEELLAIAKSYVDYSNLKTTAKKMHGWNLADAIYVIHHQPDNELKTIVQNIIWYWDGQINGQLLLSRLDIELPVQPEL